MRLPRQDTSLRLSAEPPRQAIRRDEALLDAPEGSPLERWWIASAPAVVVGIGLRHRLASVVDLERCRAAGIEIVERRAGGGVVLLDERMLCGAVRVPTGSIPADVTESYRWLGEHLRRRLEAFGIPALRRVEVAEARADVAALRRSREAGDLLAPWLLAACYGALSPHELVIGRPARKVIGLAQVRRRDASLFQVGVLLRDQAPLADVLRADDAIRESLRGALSGRTIGLESFTDRSASEVAAAIAGARPSAP